MDKWNSWWDKSISQGKPYNTIIVFFDDTCVILFTYLIYLGKLSESSWRWILNHECENTSLQNVELENCVLSHHIIVRYR